MLEIKVSRTRQERDKPTVLFCPEYFLPAVGGGEVWAWQVARGLAARGWRVIVLTYRTPEARVSEWRDGVEIVRIGPYPIRGVQSYLSRAVVQGPGILWAGVDRDFDVMLCSNTFPLLPGRVLAAAKRRPLVALFHDVYGGAFSLQEKGWLRGLIRAATERLALDLSYDHVLAVSEHVRDRLIAAGVPPSRISVVGEGVDLTEIDAVPGTRFLEPTVLYVGRLVRHKRLEALLAAFALVLRAIPNARLIVVGAGPMEGIYRRVAKQVGVAEATSFRGHVANAEKVRLMKGAHVLVLPSAHEGFGLVVAESLAAATPVIVMEEWAPRELVVDGQTGYVIRLNEPRALAARIVELLSRPGVIEYFGHTGRKRVAEAFTWPKTAARVDEVLRSIVARQQSVAGYNR